ncbi:hypothetical protein VNO78_21233 [Psophocarpus tetragonolobus]|uniref:Uncharacterized protein n=1 Tax=Psophocarpus tetragonolobus TaxID=3891 RepID=A0AAN9XHV3_PSOTE
MLVVEAFKDVEGDGVDGALIVFFFSRHLENMVIVFISEAEPLNVTEILQDGDVLDGDSEHEPSAPPMLG